MFLKNHKNNTEILVIRAGGLYLKKLYLDALTEIETALPFLSGESRGQALIRLGMILFQLNRPWEYVFQEAKKLLTGQNLRELYFNYGFSTK